MLEFFNYINYDDIKKINQERVKNFINNMKEFTDLIIPYIIDLCNIGNKLKNYI